MFWTELNQKMQFICGLIMLPIVGVFALMWVTVVVSSLFCGEDEDES